MQRNFISAIDLNDGDHLGGIQEAVYQPETDGLCLVLTGVNVITPPSPEPEAAPAPSVDSLAAPEAASDATSAAPEAEASNAVATETTQESAQETPQEKPAGRRRTVAGTTDATQPAASSE